MSDSREQFEPWFESLYHYKPIPNPKTCDTPHDTGYISMFADGAWKAWQHQQSRIDALESQLQHKQRLIAALDVFGGYENLGAQLAIAVDALDKMDEMGLFNETYIKEQIFSKRQGLIAAKNALARIKQLQEQN